MVVKDMANFLSTTSINVFLILRFPILQTVFMTIRKWESFWNSFTTTKPKITTTLDAPFTENQSNEIQKFLEQYSGVWILKIGIIDSSCLMRERYMFFPTKEDAIKMMNDIYHGRTRSKDDTLYEYTTHDPIYVPIKPIFVDERYVQE